MPFNEDFNKIPTNQKMLMPSPGDAGAPLNMEQFVLIGSEAYKQAGSKSVGIDEGFQLAFNTFRRTHTIENGKWVQKKSSKESMGEVTTLDFSSEKDMATIICGDIKITTKVLKDVV